MNKTKKIKPTNEIIGYKPLTENQLKLVNELKKKEKEVTRPDGT